MRDGHLLRMPSNDRSAAELPQLPSARSGRNGSRNGVSNTSSLESASSEIVVVGAGPAGMAAALRASESGVQVTLLDDNPGPGGQIWRGGDTAPLGSEASGWFARFSRTNVRTITSAQVISAHNASRMLLVETPDRLIELRYKKLILATGARELFLPFPGWTLPGIVGVGGLQALAKSGLPVSGKRIVVAGSGPLLLAVAAYLAEHGARVILIAEQASRRALLMFVAQLFRHPAKIIQAAGLQKNLFGIEYRQNCWVEAAEGDDRVRCLHFRQGERTWSVDCDFAAVAYGLIPNTEIASLLCCKLAAGVVAVDDLQTTSTADVFCAGENTGIGGVDLSLVEGEIAGYAAAGQAERCRPLFAKRSRVRHFADLLNRSFRLRQELKQLPKADTIVCRCEDVSYGTLQGAASFRAAKLQMRCGMGPCQGRICGPATAFLFGWKLDSIRPPIFPARIGSLAVESGSMEEESNLHP
jgi:NADPH-dependent 2,4-dienoyl-CoA reductase/sulfur reductase-like enzyme